MFGLTSKVVLSTQSDNASDREIGLEAKRMPEHLSVRAKCRSSLGFQRGSGVCVSKLQVLKRGEIGEDVLGGGAAAGGWVRSWRTSVTSEFERMSSLALGCPLLPRK